MFNLTHAPNWRWLEVASQFEMIPGCGLGLWLQVGLLLIEVLEDTVSQDEDAWSTDDHPIGQPRLLDVVSNSLVIGSRLQP